MKETQYVLHCNKYPIFTLGITEMAHDFKFQTEEGNQ